MPWRGRKQNQYVCDLIYHASPDGGGSRVAMIAQLERDRCPNGMAMGTVSTLFTTSIIRQILEWFRATGSTRAREMTKSIIRHFVFFIEGIMSSRNQFDDNRLGTEQKCINERG